MRYFRALAVANLGGRHTRRSTARAGKCSGMLRTPLLFTGLRRFVDLMWMVGRWAELV